MAVSAVAKEKAPLSGAFWEAAGSVKDAMLGWVSVALEDGIEIPEPRDPTAYRGRFLLRIPRGLHAELARQAEQEGVSLNQYVSVTLAGATGYKREATA